MKYAEMSRKSYMGAFAGLLALLVLTVAAAYVEMGPFSLIVAMGIAFAKAMLILIFFMHLKVSSALVRFAAGAGFVMLAILFALTLSDFMTR